MSSSKEFGKVKVDCELSFSTTKSIVAAPSAFKKKIPSVTSNGVVSVNCKPATISVCVASGRRLDYEGLSTTNGVVYCYSWWMKRLNSGSVWRFQQVGGSGVTNEAILIDGVPASGQTSGYTPPDDEWHRVTWKFTKTNTDLYVSSGSGCWGPRMRLGSDNEIVVLEFN